MQRVVEDDIVARVRALVARYGADDGDGHGAVEGVVLSGGVGLNVLASARVREAVGLPVHVPAAPSDCGLSVGAALHAAAPPLPPPLPAAGNAAAAAQAQAAARKARALRRAGDLAGAIAALREVKRLRAAAIAKDAGGGGSGPAGGLFHGGMQYAGFPLWDGHAVPALARAHGAARLPGGAAGAARVADALAAGRVVGLIRGAQEVGPRALGHRSLLAARHKDFADAFSRIGG